MNEKKCTNCNETKSLDEFSSGQSQCKVCRSDKARKKRKLNKESNLPIKENIIPVVVPDTAHKDELTPDDIKTLKDIAKNYNASNFTIHDFIDLNKSNRQPKSINFDIENMKQLVKISTREGISISDLINAIVSRFLKSLE